MKFKLIYIIFSIFYISLCLHLPMSLYARAGLDDALFSTLGQNILNGQWLGTFDNTVLAKGPAFPIFLALNSILGLPITLSMALLYLFSCFFLSKKLNEIGINQYFQLIIFLLILFHPYLLGYRITRDVIYPSLVILLICFVIDLLTAEKLSKNKMIIYGVIFGIFWCTREEGIWIIPSIITVLICHALLIHKKRLQLKTFFKSLFFFIFGAIFFIWVICFINYFKYGVFQVVDFKSNEYTKALNNIYGVNVGDEIPFLAVPLKKREIIYRVSPAFSELRNYFENEGLGWTMHGCSWYPDTCGDYATGWFNWALRSAVASQGYYKSAKTANSFYGRLNKEIEDACKTKLIICKTSSISFLPPLPDGQLKELPQAVINHLKLLFLITDLSEHGGPSNMPLDATNKLRYFLGNPASTLTRFEEAEDSPTVIKGWLADQKNRRSLLVLKCDGEDAFTKNINKDYAKDVVVFTGFPESYRFLIKIAPSQTHDCSLKLDNFDIKLKEIVYGKETKISRDGYFLQIEEVKIGRPMHRFRTPLEIKKVITKIYQNSLPFLTIFGILSLLVWTYITLKNKNEKINLLLISYMMWGLIATRIFLLSMIEISLYKTHAAFYQTSIFPLLILALIIPVAVLFQKTKL